MDLIFHESDISEAAQTFLTAIGDRKIVAFRGSMGAGKTTFISEVCKRSGVIESPSSPTFPIINEYKTTAGETLRHLDLYRLKTLSEAIDAGVEDCLDSGDRCFIEWPDLVASLLPENTVECEISATASDARRLQIIM